MCHRELNSSILASFSWQSISLPPTHPQDWSLFVLLIMRPLTQRSSTPTSSTNTSTIQHSLILSPLPFHPSLRVQRIPKCFTVWLGRRRNKGCEERGIVGNKTKQWGKQWQRETKEEERVTWKQSKDSIKENKERQQGKKKRLKKTGLKRKDKKRSQFGEDSRRSDLSYVLRMMLFTLVSWCIFLRTQKFILKKDHEFWVYFWLLHWTSIFNFILYFYA